MAGKKKEAQEGGKESVFEMPGTLGINQSEDFFKQLKKLSSNDKVVLDAAKVEKITTPCVQLILSLEKTMEKKKKAFFIKNPSESFKNCFSDLGLATELDKWSVEND